MLKCKNLLILFTIIMFFTFTSITPTWANQWEPRTNIALDKVWQIKFNQPVDPQTLNNNIYIKDAVDNIIPSVLTTSTDGKTVSVDAVPDYHLDQQYYLHISDQIKSFSQKRIKEATILPFTTAANTQSSTVKVHFIDVGQADSIYIQLPNHNDILIDGGNKADGQTVVNYLTSQGVDDIELMIATHPLEDHIGGLPAVLSAFPVERVIDSSKTATTDIYKEYVAAIQAENCIWGEDEKQSFTWGNTATLVIITGRESWYDDVKEYSVISKLYCGNISFLFPGDVGALVENNFTIGVDAEILKVGNHGSATSSSASFLARVNPQVAIISVGAGNTYGDPSEEALTRLTSAGARIYRTDLNGTIVVSTDGNTYTVNTQH